MNGDLVEWLFFLLTFGRKASGLFGEGPRPNLVGRFVVHTYITINGIYKRVNYSVTFIVHT